MTAADVFCMSNLLSVFATTIKVVIALCRRGWQYVEGKAALHTRKYVAYVIDAFATHLDPVDLEHLVALVQQARFVGGTSPYHSTYGQCM